MTVAETHQCSLSLECKNTECKHAKPHSPVNGTRIRCDRTACCGSWPNNPQFQPRVQCIPIEHVKERGDCPDCGGIGQKGHHPMDCIARLKKRIAELE